jgi:RNA polymerase sigma-70 factor, ECF subfamily
MAPDPTSRASAHIGADPPTVEVTVPEERRLIEAVLRKDRKATAELVAAHADAVYAYVRHRMAPRLERVDDVVHDVFLVALSDLSSFRSESSLRSWLLGIARHKIEDHYRRLLRDIETLDDDMEAGALAADEAPIEERIDRARAAERTHRIFPQLPERYSVVLLWRYWENRSIREIASATGKTEKSIERLLARAKARFRELWQEMKP